MHAPLCVYGRAFVLASLLAALGATPAVDNCSVLKNGTGAASQVTLNGKMISIYDLCEARARGSISKTTSVRTSNGSTALAVNAIDAARAFANQSYSAKAVAVVPTLQLKVKKVSRNGPVLAFALPPPHSTPPIAVAAAPPPPAASGMSLEASPRPATDLISPDMNATRAAYNHTSASTSSPSSPASSTATPNPLPSVAIPAEQTLLKAWKDLDNIQSGSPPRCDDTAGQHYSCLAFGDALYLAETGATAPMLMQGKAIPIYSVGSSKDLVQAGLTADFTPAISANDFSVSMDDNLQLVIAGKTYRLLVFSQTVDVPESAPSTGTLMMQFIPDMTSPQSLLQNFKTVVTGPEINLNQAQGESKEEDVCKGATTPVPFPIFGQIVNVTASIKCTATISLGYDIQTIADAAWATAGPTIDIDVIGTIEANSWGITGTVDGTLDLASFDGRFGAMYREFDDSYKTPRMRMVLYKPFAYYHFTAVSGFLEAHAGALGFKTKPFVFFKWNGLAPPDYSMPETAGSPGAWYVAPLASPTPAPTPAVNSNSSS